MTAVLSHLENDTCPPADPCAQGAPVARTATATYAPVVRPLLPVVGRDLRSPVVPGGTVRYANLDYAASAPALQTVADHVCSGLEHYASVHRGAGYASQVSTAIYEGTRATVAAFVGARPDDVVVVTRNTTDALNLLASAVQTDGPGGGEVVFLDVEHHANLLPWTRLPHRCVPAQETVAGTLAALEASLAQRPATLVAVTGASNVTGEVLPVADVVRIAHAHGARVVVDGAQLVPHRRVDLAAIGADYLAFSGHKVYAPFGAGVLVGRRDWLDAAPAYLAGGGAVRTVDTADSPDSATTQWAPAPQRHEGGTPNVLGAAALAQACRDLAGLPEGALEAHEASLVARLEEGLGRIPGVEVLRIWADSPDRVGVVGFTVAGHDPGRVAAYLSAEHGIGVRDGKFCAHPLLARLGHGDGAVRASLGVGSSSEDVDRLLAAVEQLVVEGETWEYTLESGRWTPVADPRPLPDFLAGIVSGTLPPAGTSPCQG
ncbi:aminotransferase class V-fold PLP-dependent enzyme [Kineosporia sp. R_H_3]|uniref:aminotransferase class V-fold PLP-dependent enzyme n=1 Tax=Kineosporia sp. R_H_3 TaxID=1961848 RepID=UPI000B4ACBEB|nr:aminotransferase class V-fold PLP-dependent enzyme [Kineosporia sp. R_H_3]